MPDCCANSACETEKLRDRQRATLLWVLWINAALFVTEGTAGLLASSTALLADALDMLGDALIYGFSLYVVARGALWKARAATLKGGIMLLFGLGVLGQAVYKMLVPELPHYPTMGLIGALALAGNAACLWLLWRHRAEDINMRSVWLCSRNLITKPHFPSAAYAPGAFDEAPTTEQRMALGQGQPDGRGRSVSHTIKMTERHRGVGGRPHLLALERLVEPVRRRLGEAGGVHAA